MLITIFGSCRQWSLNRIYNTTSIQEDVSYTHYTKEVLELIKYCKKNHIDNQLIKSIFSAPIIKKASINYDKIKEEFYQTDLFVIEICSKKKYSYNGIYCHFITVEDKYNLSCKPEIKIEIQTKEEIELDILEIKKELNKPFIIVSHLVTIESGKRFELAEWLEEICIKHDIPFINPIRELKKRNINLDNLFLRENKLLHYNDRGQDRIGLIYKEFIDGLIIKKNF